jgi:Fe-S oxidoreductase
MPVDNLNLYVRDCFQGLAPNCVSACPLKLDVRSFVGKLQKGSWSAAYRIYRNTVLFPGLVSVLCDAPCRCKCVGSAAGIPIEMSYLERSCVAFSKDRTGITYNMPSKDYHIAVIGAGLSGMSCALKLVSHRYNVTIYEKTALPGGRLKQLLPQELYISEFEKAFGGGVYKMEPSREINSLSDVDADAIYVATGSGCNHFGLLDEGLDSQSLGTRRRGVFLGGDLLHCTPVESIEYGVRAANSIEKYLKTGLMDGSPEVYSKGAVHDRHSWIVLSAGNAVPDDPDVEAAVAEANRCALCDCDKCISTCDLMKFFRRNPKKTAMEVDVTLHPLEQLSKRVASRMINSCNQCGLCREVCPEDVDMEAMLREAKYHLHQDGALPEAYHDFWIRDMAIANSAHAGGGLFPEDRGSSQYMYFPGCQLGASHPAYVVESYRYLDDILPSLSLLLGCCGIPAEWAGNRGLFDEALARITIFWEKAGEPIVILACPSCRKTFARHLPQIETVSLYGIMAEHRLQEWSGLGNESSVCVYDPCSSRYDPNTQDSVRALLKAAGFLIEELPQHGAYARCCSYGGHIKAVNGEHVDRILKDRIVSNGSEYICYCSNCRDVFAEEGKPARHILDVFFGIGSSERRPPNLSDRRENRVSTMKLLGMNDGIENKEQDIDLHISDEHQDKMNKALILEEDVRSVIEYCEKTGNKLQNTATGEYIGKKSNGVITFWVYYLKEGASFTLTNVYSHRMRLEEDRK